MQFKQEKKTSSEILYYSPTQNHKLLQQKNIYEKYKN